ncbi:MAG TPA: non-canonical purine NTP pyrophosphatase [Chloroflexota bacterium]
MIEGLRRRPLLLASTNPRKRERLAWLVEGLGVSCAAPPADLGPSETGSTHRANAEIKAVAWSRQVGGLALASDGGVHIPALGPRWSSVTTARAAGAPPGDDLARIAHLLALLQPYRGDERRVVWREAVALADDGRLLGSWEAEGPEGIVLESPPDRLRRPGLWVEEVWWCPALGKVLAEASLDEIERLGSAWARLRPLVRACLQRALQAPD